MTIENSQKSKKYVITKLDYSVFDEDAEKEIGRFDTLQECAEFIINNNEYWHKCLYGKKNLTEELCDLVVKFKKFKKRCNSLESDFL